MPKTMSRDQIAESVTKIVVEYLDVDKSDVKPEASFIDDLGADSLGLIEVLLAVEEVFDIEIPDEDTDKITTVQQAIDYLAGRLGTP